MVRIAVASWVLTLTLSLPGLVSVARAEPEEIATSQPSVPDTHETSTSQPAATEEQPTSRPATAPFDRLQARLAAVAPEERRMAALGLGNLGDRRATEPLKTLLEKDPVPSVRSAAARALGALEARNAASALWVAARTDNDPGVRAAAQVALDKIEHAKGGDDTAGLPRLRLGRDRAELLLKNDFEYQAGKRAVRQGGIVIGIGTGLGAALFALSAVVYFVREPESETCWEEYRGLDCLFGDCKVTVCNTVRQPYFSGSTLFLFVAGCVSAGLSLGVGLPLAISGARTMAKARAKLQSRWIPQVAVSPTRGGGHFGARWQF